MDYDTWKWKGFDDGDWGDGVQDMDDEEQVPEDEAFRGSRALQRLRQAAAEERQAQEMRGVY